MRATAQKFSQALGNLRNTIYGTPVNQHTANEKEIFAKQHLKSPLETIDRSDEAHLKPENDPLKYGTKYYPLEVAGSKAEGHYMIFYIIMNNKTDMYGTTSNQGKIQVTNDSGLATTLPGQSDQAKKGIQVNKILSSGERVDTILRGQRTGLTAGGAQTHSILSDAICLYMPQTGVKTTYSAEYENSDTELAGFLGETLRDLLDGDGNFFDKLKQGGSAILDAAEPLLTRALTGALSVIPGVGDINAVVDKKRARALNPQAEFVFKRVPFRTFTFPFTFAPKNEQEMYAVHDIINLFKFHMMPEFSSQMTQGRYFSVPSEFEIRYMYRDRENLYLPKVSRCALTSCDIDYAPQNKFKTFMGNDRGAPPTIINMSLSFTEMEIMTKETIAKGY